VVIGIGADLRSGHDYHSPEIIVQVEAVGHDGDHDEQQPVERNICEDEEQLEDDETREDDDQYGCQ